MITAAANAGVRPEVCRDFLKVRDARLDRPVPPAADPEISRPSIPSWTPREREGFDAGGPTRACGWVALDRGSRLTPTKPCSERPHRRAHAFETTADTRTTAKMALSPRHRCVRVLLPLPPLSPPSRLSSRREIASSFTRSHPPPASLRAASTPRTEPDPTRHFPRGRSARSPARSPTSRYAATSRTGGASALAVASTTGPPANSPPRRRRRLSQGARRPSPRSPRSTVNPYRLTRSIEP